MKVTYHTNHSFEKEGKKHSFVTQLYKIGVYGILNNDSSMQANFKPTEIFYMEKQLIKDEKDGKIKNLQFGRSITVDNSSGFWEEIIKDSNTSSNKLNVVTEIIKEMKCKVVKDK